MEQPNRLASSGSITEKVPPQDLEAEQVTLGAMLLEAGAASRALSILKADDLYRDVHRMIFEAIQQVSLRDQPVDLVTVSAELRRMGRLDAVGGPEYLSALIDEVPTAAHVVRYAQIVQEKATLRRLIEAGSYIAGLGYDNPPDVEATVDEAERRIFELAQRRITRDFVHIGPVVKETFEVLDKRQHRENYLTGISTGLSDLDDLTGGLQNSNLIIVAGRPSMGKSSLAIFNFALHAALREGTPVGIFSLEESSRQLAEGMLASEAHVNAWRLRRGGLNPDDWGKISGALAQLPNAPIYVDDTPGISVLEIRGKARRLKAEHNIGLIILDYLQLATAGAELEGRYQEVSLIARSLKSLARELDIPVLACSQLSRRVEHREEKRPMLSDLLESGAIEAEADLVLFVYRPAYYERRAQAAQEAEQTGQASYAARSRGPAHTDEPDPAEIIVAKHRSGPIGTVHCMFHGAHRRFENLSSRAAPT